MNPVKQIGRYQFPILSVIAIVKQDDGTYEFILPYNTKLILTEEEKRLYEQAMERHGLTMQLYGACKGAGLRG
jgi:hypothetical protein